jgi:hypothetical protein
VSAARQVMLLASHQVLTHNVAVKIFRRVVVHQTVLVRLDKLETALILVVRVLHQWIAINLVCVHEFLSQIFQKMSQAKS